jgi:hypothetical protein
MKRSYNLLFTFLLLSAACRQHTNIEQRAANSIRDGLNNSNRILARITDGNYRLLEESLNDPFMAQRASIWNPKIRLLKKASRDCLSYIDSLVENKVAISRQLAEKLSAYQDILNSITTEIPVRVDQGGDEMPSVSFALLQQALVSKIKNDVLIAQYKMVDFFIEQIKHPRWCIDYGPQFMISNTRVHTGDTILVTGWYGLTVSDIGLTMTVRDTTVSQISDYPIEYKFIANGPPGAHSLPIGLRYMKPDGSWGTVQKTFKYTIKP